MSQSTDFDMTKLMESEVDNYCIETIAPNKENWFLRIGHRIINLNYLRNDTIWNRNFLTCELCETETYQIVFSLPQEDELLFQRAIREDPLPHFNFMVELCLKNPYILMRLAQFLSGKTVDAICKHVFTAKDIDIQFVTSFYDIFIPIYLRRAYSWFTLDILLRAKKAYPEMFKKLILLLLKDTQVKSIILHDYVQNANDQVRNDFLKSIIEHQLTPYEFSNNLTAIYLAFKDCEMDESIYQFIFNHLERHGYYCIYNKNYGRLLLSLIEKISGGNVRFRALKKVVDKHCTPYKNLCLSALEKVINEMIALQFNLQERSMFVIPRPNDTLQL